MARKGELRSRRPAHRLCRSPSSALSTSVLRTDQPWYDDARERLRSSPGKIATRRLGATASRVWTGSAGRPLARRNVRSEDSGTDEQRGAEVACGIFVFGAAGLPLVGGHSQPLEAMMSRIRGGCLCGAVRYLSKSEPVMTALCHCTHCQRQSGGAFSVNVAVAKGSLEFQGSEPATYEDRGESGGKVLRRFCGKCGSSLLSEVDATPTLDWLKAGTLDDTSWVQPQASIWCDSAQA